MRVQSKVTDPNCYVLDLEHAQAGGETEEFT